MCKFELNKIYVSQKGVYEKYIKRLIDILLSSISIILLSWLILLVALLVRIKLGSPVIFKQARPGIIDTNTYQETIFFMYKFRTMTNEKDDSGNLLPDSERMTKFGTWLRETSLDELPELFNILNGSMSIIGPRPQLVRDMFFMSDEQRKRHTVKPGLSGLAQVNGRNAISWEKKINLDLEYIQNISLLNDIKIVYQTFLKAIFKREGITSENSVTAEDLGDYLLRVNKIDEEQYKLKQFIAESILEGKRK